MENRFVETQEDKEFLQNIDQADEQTIKKFIEKQLNKMVVMIEDSIQNAKQAEEKLSKVKKLDIRSDKITYLPVIGGFLGRTSEDKKIEILAESQELHQKATAQLTDIVQESIKFCTISFNVAVGMYNSLNILIASGVVTVDGATRTLSKEAREKFENIHKFTKAFIEEHSKHRQSIVNHGEKIDSIQELLNVKEQIEHKRQETIDNNYKEFLDFKEKLEVILDQYDMRVSVLESRLNRNSRIFGIFSIVILIAIVIMIIFGLKFN